MRPEEGMTREDVFALVRSTIRDVLTDVPASEVVAERNLRDLGANSLDRMDITVSVIEELGLPMDPADLSAANSIGALVDLLHGRLR